MYAQYQQYQQQSSSTGNMTWNGSAWVPKSSSVPSSTHSTYQQPATSPPNNSSIPPNPVQTFTAYYTGWQNHLKECENQLGRTVNPTDRAEVERRVGWARYYSDQSSRAAYHFHDHPQATSAPFELPPSPPGYQPKQKPSQPAASSQDDENTPGSLTRYLKRCRDLCTTDEQKKQVQVQVEQAIAKAIQTNTLHTKNWDIEPMISLPGMAVQQPQSSYASSSSPQFASTPFSHSNSYHHYPSNNQHSNQQKSTSNGYYGASASSRSPTNGYKQKYGNHRYDSNSPENSGYYGHAGANAPSSSSHRNRPLDGGGYYGPASNNDPNSSSSSSSPLQKHKRIASPQGDYISLQPSASKKAKKNKRSSKQNKDIQSFQVSSDVLAKRANRFSGPGGIVDASSTATSVSDHDRYMGKSVIGGGNKSKNGWYGNNKMELDENDFELMTVRGTCQTLEKEYLRLTAPPRAELVRPQPVLERHLTKLKQEYETKAKNHDYLWFCSQFKAVRQDCTVQRIQNEFALDVYETHAKIALQEGDLNEYNQCQTQLKELYDKNAAGGHCMKNHEEFIAYRLLYYVFLRTNEKYDGGSSDMFKIMLSLTPQQRGNAAIAHALCIREAVETCDYLEFFRLHAKAPNLGKYLTERIVPTMRMRALRRVARAYRPNVDVEFCIEQVGFGDSPQIGKEWLKSCGCKIDGALFLTKDTVDVHEPVVDKKNSLI